MTILDNRNKIEDFKNLSTKFESNLKKFSNEDTIKMLAVKEAMKFAWDKYKQYSWGHDELNPLTKTSKDWLGLGLTIIDSIDTLFIMGLMDEYKDARDFIATLEFEVDRSSSVFEMNIRILGGLLSTYSLTNDQVFLNQAKKFGDILLHAWVNNNTAPFPVINLQTKQVGQLSWAGGNSPLADIGSLTVEFCTLSKYTGNTTYCRKTLEITESLRVISTDGLVTSYVGISGGPVQSIPSKLTMGGLADSYYEYLLKMWILTQKKVPKFRKMYDDAVEGAKHVLITKANNGLVFLKDNWSNSMEHLTCFAGGMFALGAKSDTQNDRSSDLEIGAKITETCREMYHRTATGLGPESITFDQEGNIYPSISFYVLRPETVESFFVLWRMTKDQKYRDWAWDAFVSLNTSCRGEEGFFGLNDVNSMNNPRDPQESFFMAETLKYLYLSFTSDDVISLDKWVFNTEAHPVSVWEDDVDSWLPMFYDFDPSINPKSQKKG